VEEVSEEDGIQAEEVVGDQDNDLPTILLASSVEREDTISKIATVEKVILLK
jgi:hypothetical protein